MARGQGPWAGKTWRDSEDMFGVSTPAMSTGRRLRSPALAYAGPGLMQWQ